MWITCKSDCGSIFTWRPLNTELSILHWTPQWIWRRYVDDTFVVQKQAHKEEFFHHINTVGLSIQFTAEEPRPDGSIPFLDILVIPQTDGTFTTKVYRKPTHTDLYLQWDSHHNLAANYSVINTLTHRARAICSTSQLLTSELQHLERVRNVMQISQVGHKQKSSKKQQHPTEGHNQ